MVSVLHNCLYIDFRTASELKSVISCISGRSGQIIDQIYLGFHRRQKLKYVDIEANKSNELDKCVQ